jgi:hypothetical protein
MTPATLSPHYQLGKSVALHRRHLQTGMLSLLSEEHAGMLEAALIAIRERHAAFPQPSLGNVSPEQCRQWLDRLLEIFDDFSFDGNVVAPTPAHFAVVTTWWAYANRQAKAIRSLADNGMGGDAVPLARSMIEFALWSVALSQDTGPLLSTVLRNSDGRTTLCTARTAGPQPDREDYPQSQSATCTRITAPYQN